LEPPPRRSEMNGGITTAVSRRHLCVRSGCSTVEPRRCGWP
jgi:hypothetical protein